jgi:O-antigen/teichoic acid export membrane protein
MASSKQDLTGRKNMAGNVLASWAGQGIFIIAGFVMPRMIDRRLGQELLGVWDFSWSLVSYFSLVQVGVIGSISRYVAMHQAKNDGDGVNRSISSAACILLVMAGIIASLALGAFFSLGWFRGAALGVYLQDARWVVLILGLEIALQTVSSVYAGILTGSHRWGIHNAINAASYFFSVAGMITALLLGRGLRTLALIHFLGEAGSAVARYFFSHRICPALRIRLSLARWETVREMLRYGTKSWVPSIGDLILNQTTSVLIFTCLGPAGPASLAVFSRSRSLVRYVRDLVMKMAGVLTASVGSLYAAGEHRQIQDLVIKATRYSAYLALPMAMVLLIAGGPILHLWMGARYASAGVVAVLTIGQTAAVLQLPALAILAGMNRHGRVALANGLGSIVAVIAVWVTLGVLKMGLLPVAIAVTAPLLFVNLVYSPLNTCRSIDLSVVIFFKRALLSPLLGTLPMAVCLLGARWLLPDRPTISLIVGCALGGTILLPLYWHYVLPSSLKKMVLKRLSREKRLPAPTLEGVKADEAPIP